MALGTLGHSRHWTTEIGYSDKRWWVVVACLLGDGPPSLGELHSPRPRSRVHQQQPGFAGMQHEELGMKNQLPSQVKGQRVWFQQATLQSWPVPIHSPVSPQGPSLPALVPSKARVSQAQGGATGACLLARPAMEPWTPDKLCAQQIPPGAPVSQRPTQGAPGTPLALRGHHAGHPAPRGLCLAVFPLCPGLTLLPASVQRPCLQACPTCTGPPSAGLAVEPSP